MSLDVALIGPVETATCECPLCGNEHTCQHAETLFSANITHNLNRMAGAAGIYEALWSPGKIGAGRASDLIDFLSAGLARLEADPQGFEQFNATNGWGTYDQFVPWVRQYLKACQEYPDADIHISK